MKKDPEEISLLEIYESAAGKIEIEITLLINPVCRFEKYIFNNVTMKMTEGFVEYMKKRNFPISFKTFQSLL
jgi:hypothetical protein